MSRENETVDPVRAIPTFVGKHSVPNESAHVELLRDPEGETRVDYFIRERGSKRADIKNESFTYS